MKILRQLRHLAFWTVAVLISLPVLLSVWLHWFFPGDLLKRELTDFVKKKYDLTVNIRELNVSLFSGITVSGFQLAPDQQGLDSLAGFHSLKLAYKILPLLKKRIVIDEITLLDPTIKLNRTASGVWNWQLLLDKLKKSAKPQAEKPKSASAGPTISFELDELQVDNLSLQLTDRQSGTIVRLQGFNLLIQDFQFDDKEHYYGRIKLGFKEDSPFSVRRQDLYLLAQLADFEVNIKADPARINVQTGIDILPEKIWFRDKNLAGTGNLSFDLSASYFSKNDSLAVGDFDFKLGRLMGFKAVLQGSQLKKSERIIRLGKGDFTADPALLLSYLKTTGFLPKEQLPVTIPAGHIAVSDIYLTAEPQKKNFQAAATVNLQLNNLTFNKNQLSALVKEIKFNGNYNIQLKNQKLTAADLPSSLFLKSVTVKSGSREFALQQMEALVDPVLKADFMPEQLQARLHITDLNGCNVTDSLTVILPTDLKIPGLLTRLRMENRLSVRNFNPDAFVDNLPINTAINLDQRFSLDRGVFDVAMQGDLLHNELLLKKDKQLLPDQNFSMILNGSVLNLPDSIQISAVKINAGNFSEVKLDQLVYRLKSKQAEISGLSLEVWLDKLLLAAGTLPVKMKQNISLGEGKATALINARIDLLNKKQQADGNLNLILPALLYNKEISLSGLQMEEKFTLRNRDLTAEGSLKLSKADFKNLLTPLGIGSYSSEHKITLADFHKLTIENLTFAVNSLGRHLVSVKGRVDLKNIFKGLYLNVENSLTFKDSYPFVRQVKGLTGSLTNRITVSSDTSALIKIKQQHELRNLSLVVKLDSAATKTVKVEGLNLTLPVNLAYNLNENKLAAWQNWPPLPADLLIYRKNRPAYSVQGWPVKNLSVKQIVVNAGKLQSRINNLESDLYFDNNRFFLNYFYLDILGGNIDGRLAVVVPEKLDSTLKSDVRTAFSLTASGINTALLNSAGTKSSSSELNFTADFRTKGLDFIKNPDVEGDLNITRISDEDAKALLEFLNKGSADQTLEMLKNTLNYFPGIKLSLFSFQLKNNFIYTLIKLHKPLYLFYFPLAEEIRPSKQSLRFYLDKYVKD